MNSLEREQQELVDADERISAAEKRIATQEARVRDSSRLGRDTRSSEELLLTMRRLLETMHICRQQIVEEIERQTHLRSQRRKAFEPE
jgi:hypothetical protein